ncbi:MAG: AAA family ATPase [Akkermansia sp.]
MVANKKEIRQKLLIAKALAYDSTKSYLFGKEGFDIFSRELKGEKQTILIALGNFAKLYLTVIERSQSGVIPLNLLPMSLVADVGHGSLPIVLTQPNVMPIPMYEGLKNLLNQINTVLLHIIPGLSINIEKLGTEFLPDGSQGMRFELVSLREENKIPLRYESEGIKKLVSILGVLIDMYNKPYICLVIDELDAGIYEYLLGELFHIIEEGGKGQLIFTSHNLRPLEMIHKNNIVFTTTNPINRFIRFTGIKKDHNLRDMYIRTINLSGQSEEVYAPTESSAIGRAFRRAGKELI